MHVTNPPKPTNLRPTNPPPTSNKSFSSSPSSIILPPNPTNKGKNPLMDLQPDELQSLSSLDILRESASIPRASPRTFGLLTLSLVFPLSFAVLIHSLFTHPLLLRLESPSPSSPSPNLSLLSLYQFVYLLLLFAFSLLSTSSVVFTVASLYASKPVSFSASLSAIPPILPRLFRTFLWVSLLMLCYNLVFAFSVAILIFAYPSSSESLLFLIVLSLLIAGFIAAHVFISALWHLASVVSVLEPVCGLEAMRKARQLLRGRARMAAILVSGYLSSCGVIGWAFRAFVVKGKAEEGSFGLGVVAKVLVGGGLVAVLVLVNFVGLLAQSVFYYVCKSFHRQAIDKSALCDHLGGYLGEYVPLKSSIQMENL